MEQQQISAKKLKAMENVKRANAGLAKVVREEKEQLRKTQDRHKYMMGGCVVKYFPEAYDFSEQLSRRYLALKDEVKEAEQIRKGVYSILREEQREQQPHKEQDIGL